MHAVVGNVSVQSGREDEAVEFLKTEVLPRVRQAPGLVAGYWLAPEDGHGFGITFFESGDAAQSAMKMARNNPTPDYVTWDSIDVREVIAQL